MSNLRSTHVFKMQVAREYENGQSLQQRSLAFEGGMVTKSQDQSVENGYGPKSSLNDM
jgi:hypothetical protein